MDITLAIKAAVVGSLIVAGLAYNYVFKQQPDNPVEQAIESVIESQAGIRIDLSPDSNKE